MLAAAATLFLFTRVDESLTASAFDKAFGGPAPVHAAFVRFCVPSSNECDRQENLWSDLCNDDAELQRDNAILIASVNCADEDSQFLCVKHNISGVTICLPNDLERCQTQPRPEP